MSVLLEVVDVSEWMWRVMACPLRMFRVDISGD